MSNAARNKQTAMTMWWNLYEEHDYDAVGALFSPEGHYTDMATNDEGGRGPEAIANRLRMGLEPLKEHFHNIRSITAEGDIVVTEHFETWVWDDDHRVTLPFVSMQQFDTEGRIVRWWDYWNYTTLIGSAPQWWFEHLAQFSSTDLQS